MEYNLKKDYNKLKIYIVNSKVASNITKQTIIVNNPAKERRLNHKNAKRWQKKKNRWHKYFFKNQGDKPKPDYINDYIDLNGLHTSIRSQLYHFALKTRPIIYSCEKHTLI